MAIAPLASVLSRVLVYRAKGVKLREQLDQYSVGFPATKSGVDKPLEACFSFGSHARYYVERGMGRWISQEETLEILDQCEEAGLVPRPAEIVISNYYALVDSDLCAACETCLDRCQMEAITIGPEEVAEVNLDRCIGCGLCVTTCTTEALSLQPKPEEERREPPEKPRDAMMQMAQQRGKSLIPLAFTKTSQSGS